MIHAKHSDVSGKWCLLKDGSVVKNLASVQETRVQSLGGEGPLEKGMATHSTISAWRILQTEEPAELHSPWVRKKWDTTEQLPLSCFQKWVQESQEPHTYF